jgi:hypothetical protein
MNLTKDAVFLVFLFVLSLVALGIGIAAIVKAKPNHEKFENVMATQGCIDTQNCPPGPSGEYCRQQCRNVALGLGGGYPPNTPLQLNYGIE